MQSTGSANVVQLCGYRSQRFTGWPEGPGYWAVLGHSETKQVLRDAATFSSNLAGTQLRTPTRPEDLAFVRQMMLNQDPPAHNRLRGLLSKAFIPRAIAALDAEISSRAHDLVQNVAHKGRCDFVTDIVGDLPVAVLASVLGLPDQDRGLLYDWFQPCDWVSRRRLCLERSLRSSYRLRYGTSLRWHIGRCQMASGALPDPRTRAGLADMYAYAQALAEYRRVEPGDDIVSLLLHADFDGPALTNDEFETLFFLSRCCWQRDTAQWHPWCRADVDREPDQYDLLLREPDLLDGAVEELLRYWPPVIHFRRTATVDCEIGGQAITAGDKVAVYHLAANRDPDVFDNPHQLDLRRTGVDHVSFGFGPHFCLGAHLARRQMKSMLGELARQLGRLELVGDPIRLTSNFQQGLKSLPVSWNLP